MHEERWKATLPNIGQPKTNKRKQLHDLIEHHFSMEELEGLMFDLEVDWEQLSGETKGAKVRSIILHFMYRQGLSGLVETLAMVRPQADWPTFER